jgi:hypothetical protein
MDEATAEQLSRYLDDDLSHAEVRELEARLTADPALAAELDALKALKRSVAAVADEMEPPAALDDLMEPLRSGAPHGHRRIHPVVRVVGIAAGLALAATVVLEVARRGPDETSILTDAPPEAASAPSADETRVFQLGPLPTSTVPEDDQPVGATDRLLASPPTEPKLDEPVPLEVRGPLSAAEKKAADKGRAQAETPSRSRPPAPATEEKMKREPTAGKEAPAVAALEVARQQKNDAPTEPPVAVLLVGADGAVVATVRLPAPVPAGSTVVVKDGVIVELLADDLDGEGGAPSSDWLGRPVEDVPNGRYRIVLSAHGPPDSTR